MHGDYADAIFMGLALAAVSVIALIFLIWWAIACVLSQPASWLHWAGGLSAVWWCGILVFVAWSRWIASP